MNNIERLNQILLSKDETNVTKEAVIRLLDKAEQEKKGVQNDSRKGRNLSDKIDILVKVLSKLM